MSTLLLDQKYPSLNRPFMMWYAEGTIVNVSPTTQLIFNECGESYSKSDEIYFAYVHEITPIAGMTLGWGGACCCGCWASSSRNWGRWGISPATDFLPLFVLGWHPMPHPVPPNQNFPPKIHCFHPFEKIRDENLNKLCSLRSHEFFVWVIWRSLHEPCGDFNFTYPLNSVLLIQWTQLSKIHSCSLLFLFQHSWRIILSVSQIFC